jgi:hypothetical protein
MRTMVALLLHGLLVAGAQPGASGPGVTNTDMDGAVTGVYALSFHPEVSRPLPPGAMVVCRARILPGVNAVQPAMGTAGGNQSGCALEIPFAWAANRPRPVATLGYEVDEIGSDGRVLRRVVREGVVLPESAAGTARHIDVAF